MTEISDLGDQQQVSERKDKIRRQERSDAEEFKALMERRGFRAFVWRLLGEAQVFQPIMTGNSYTFMNEGKRQIGLWVLEQINRHCPDLYVTMTKEALSLPICLSACATKQASLQPLSPVIETVAVYRDLPDSLLHPCDEPIWSPSEITTDVDLLGLLNKYRSVNACNAGKIDAIDTIYRGKRGSTG